jgi:hypothetical protein
MQIAGSASGTNKHDGDNNTTECLPIILFVNVEFAQCVSCRQGNGTIGLTKELPRWN